MTLQLVGERDEIGRLAPLVEIKCCSIDDLVIPTIEVVVLQEFGDARDGVAVNQNAPEDRLLGLDILRRKAFLGICSIGNRSSGSCAIYCHSKENHNA